MSLGEQALDEFPEDPQTGGNSPKRTIIVQDGGKGIRLSVATGKGRLEGLQSSIQSYVSPNSLHTVSYNNTQSPYEQEELRAVKFSENLIDKWVRNI